MNNPVQWIPILLLILMYEADDLFVKNFAETTLVNASVITNRVFTT